jgi:hypothetical protein
MKLRGRKKPEELTKSPNAETLRKRAETLSEEEILEGLDQFCSNLGKYVGAYRRTKAYDLMCEIQTTGSAVFALSDVLLSRKENKLGIPDAEQIKSARQVRSF